MSKNRFTRGAALTDMLMAASAAALLLLACVLGLSSAMHVIEAATAKSTADALALTASEQIKNELRFAEDPNATILSMSDYQAELNGMSVEGLTFWTESDGTVIFCFTVGKYSYEYSVYPLNWDYTPN